MSTSANGIPFSQLIQRGTIQDLHIFSFPHFYISTFSGFAHFLISTFSEFSHFHIGTFSHWYIGIYRFTNCATNVASVTTLLPTYTVPCISQMPLRIGAFNSIFKIIVSPGTTFDLNLQLSIFKK